MAERADPQGVDPQGPTPSTVEITVGVIGRAHGLRGDVLVQVRTDEPERRFVPGAQFSTQGGELVLVSTRWHGVRLLATFADVGDRAAADLLRGIELTVAVPVDERPADLEEFYDHQLRGLAACTVGGEHLGVVTDILHLPAQDTLVLEVDGREVLVPFVAEIVTAVDPSAGRLVIAALPGLLAETPEDGSSA
ncbi:MAG: ribosome maturation factor RimM [Nocardioidaceae bacterium]